MSHPLNIECIEPRKRPLRRRCVVTAGKEFSVNLLQEDLNGGPTLRQTVLARRGEYPPSDARLVVWVQALDEGFVVNEVGRGIELELVRADARSRVVRGMRLGRRAQLDVRMPGQARVPFTLAMDHNVTQGAALTVSGGRSKAGNVQFAADNVMWPITDTKGILVTFGVRVMDGLRDRLRTMGVDGRVFTFMSGLIVAGGAMGYFAWSESRARAAAEERAAAAEEAVELAQAAREASLQSELVCISDRRDLSGRLGEVQAATRLAATEALELTASHTLAAERGGPALQSPGLQTLDLAAREALIEATIGAIPLTSTSAEPCIRQTAALGLDVPTYLLTWHPDAQLSCPSSYRAVRNGQELVGPWGLSDRFARDFGERGDRFLGTADATADVLSDPREEPRWAAYTAAAGFRQVVQSLLRDQGAGRPSVLPSQLQLWALTLTDAYNRMPSPAEGAVDRRADECISALLGRQARTQRAAPPDTPVLPDFVDVLLGAQPVPAPPSAGCPWPADSITHSASHAMAAVGRMAALRRDGVLQDEEN